MRGLSLSLSLSLSPSPSLWHPTFARARRVGRFIFIFLGGGFLPCTRNRAEVGAGLLLYNWRDVQPPRVGTCLAGG